MFVLKIDAKRYRSLIGDGLATWVCTRLCFSKFLRCAVLCYSCWFPVHWWPESLLTFHWGPVFWWPVFVSASACSSASCQFSGSKHCVLRLGWMPVFWLNFLILLAASFLVASLFIPLLVSSSLVARVCFSSFFRSLGASLLVASLFIPLLVSNSLVARVYFFSLVAGCQFSGGQPFYSFAGFQFTGGQGLLFFFSFSLAASFLVASLFIPLLVSRSLVARVYFFSLSLAASFLVASLLIPLLVSSALVARVYLSFP